MMRALLFPAILLAFFLPLTAGGYDLEAYLKLVEANSQDLQLARRDISAAEADIRAAYSAVLPTIAGSASYLRNLAPLYYYQGGQKIEVVDDDNQFSLGLSASQNLFNMQAFSGIRASNEYRKLSAELFDAQRSGLLAAAKKSFYLALLLEQVYRVRRASEENAAENYRNVQRKFDSGLVSQLSVLQAEVAWKTKIPETTQARKNLEVAILNLKNLAGLAKDEEVKLEGDLDNFPALPEGAGAEAVLASRADYRALLAQHRLRQIGVEAARAQAFPVVSASLVYGFSAQSDELKLDQENKALQLELSVNAPIYTGGYIASQINKAENEVAKAAIQLQKKRQEISIEIEELSLRLREAHERILSAQATVSAAEKALSITGASAETGLATQLDLKDAQVSYDNARLGYYSAINDYLSAYFDWEQASGRLEKSTEKL